MYASGYQASLEDEIESLKEKIKRQDFIIKKQTVELHSLVSKLSEAKQQYHQFYQFNPSCFLTIDHNFNIQHINNEAAVLLNTPPGNLIGTTLLKFCDEYGKTLIKNK